jgi:hypothetical protein
MELIGLVATAVFTPLALLALRAARARSHAPAPAAASELEDSVRRQLYGPPRQSSRGRVPAVAGSSASGRRHS